LTCIRSIQIEINLVENSNLHTSKSMKTLPILFLVCSILFSCSNAVEKTGNNEMNQPYRPQFHFSPKRGWMNDPNGMVYYKGKYHVFYQHYPDSTVWGPMHWGHATSTDLIHWEHLPIALYPDSLGMIFSGSAVVDKFNTSGLGTIENPPLVAMFTYHDMAGEQAGRNDFQTQGIAFSLDSGATWTKYSGNPVIKNPGIRDFRDPKLTWWEEGSEWIVTLAVKDHLEFYGSQDLKNWTRRSEFGQTIGNHGGVWECPDLFKIKDNEGVDHWVLLVSINPGAPKGGSGTQYFIGDFKSGVFNPHDTVTRWIDQGADNYAGVTWSNIPESDGRRIFMGWMSNWNYANQVPTDLWRSALTLPREIGLVKKPNDWLLTFSPVKEIEKITGDRSEFTGKGILESQQALIEFDTKNGVFDLSISNGKNEAFYVRIENGLFVTDRSQSGKTNFHQKFGTTHNTLLNGIQVNHVKVFLDWSSVEIFINEGELVISELVFPSSPFNKIEFKDQRQTYTVAQMKSIWSEQ
jgi:fructan beta-fructosidase